MKKNLLLLAVALVGIWVATMIGYRLGCNKAADFFLQQELSSNLTNLSANIKIAELLQTNQKEKAEELLENLIDACVSSLGVQVNQKSFAPMRIEILESIKEAEVYRTKLTSPDHRVNENLKRGVDAAFGSGQGAPYILRK